MKRNYTIFLFFIITLTNFATDSLNVRSISHTLNDTTCFAVKDVYVQGDYAYCACDRDGLIILDVSDLTHPAEVGRLDTPGFAEAVRVRDTLAFVADWNGGLRIIDISNPAIPTEIGTTQVHEPALFITLREDYAYVGTRGAGVKIVDITDPRYPSVLYIPSFDFNQIVRSIIEYGDHEIVSGNPDPGETIRIVDMSDPWSISVFEEIGYEKIIYCSAKVDSFILLGVFNGIDIYRNTLATWYFEHEVLYETCTEGSWVKDMAVNGTYLFTASSYNGIRVYDVSNPASSLPEIGYYDTESRANAVFIVDSLAYVADMESGLYILDISSLPDAVAEQNLPTTSDIRIYPNPFNATCNISWSGRIEIFDISGRLIDELNAPCTWKPDEKTASGVYLIKVKGGEECKKLVLLR